MTNAALPITSKLAGYGYDLASTGNTPVSSSSSAHVKGSWTELAASIDGPLDAIQVNVSTSGGSLYKGLFDLGVGAAGNEQVIVPNAYFETDGRIGFLIQYLLSAHLPAGSRVAMRVQDDLASAVDTFCWLAGWHGGPVFPAGVGRLEEAGIATGSSSATQVDPGGTANTKGSWTELVASTVSPWLGFVPIFGSNKNNVETAATFRVDIGVGAAGSEQVVAPNLMVRGDAAMDVKMPYCYPPIWQPIPAGSRIAARAQSQTTDATDRLVQVALEGFVG